MNIVVNDTNIFIDLFELKLLEEFFQLPWEVHTTDMVMSELKREGQLQLVSKYKDQGTLHVKAFDITETATIWQMYKEHQGKTNVSLEDCSVWLYAKQTGSPLLTGDKKLRNSASKSGVEVHGIIYIFDKFVEHQVLVPALAAEKLKELQKLNARLPKDEIEKRIKEWGDSNNNKG